MYLTNPPWDTGITPPELVSFIESSPPGKALDPGCGAGTNAIYMAQKGWEASGVMQFEWRQDGVERGARASAWLRYRK